MAAPCSRCRAWVSASGPSLRPIGALPRGQEPGERRGIDRLHLPAQRRERATADPSQHVRVAPFPLEAAGPELAVHDTVDGGERLEGLADTAGIDPQAVERRRP